MPSPPLEIKLTASGRRKLRTLEKRISGIAERVLKEGMEGIVKPEVMNRAPGPEEEARMLSAGKIEGQGALAFDPIGLSAIPRFGEAGTPEGGRFLKEGHGSIRNVIARDKIVMSRSGNKVYAKFGNTRWINQRTGFSWRTASGDVRNTKPFNRKLIQSLEHGGTWVVRPRTSKFLHPEPGVYATQMRKTLPAIRMFHKGGRAALPRLKKFIELRLDQEIRARMGARR